MPRLYEDTETYETDFEYFDEMEQADLEAGINEEMEFEEETQDAEYQEEMEEEFEESPHFSRSRFHPQLGFGRPVAGELEWEDQEEEIIGKADTRRPIRNTKAAPYRWICQLEMIYQDAGLWGGAPTAFVGSGLLISPRHVLTAGHNVRNSFGGKLLDAKSVTVAPGRDRASFPFGTAKMKKFDCRPEWRSSLNHCHDFAVLTLESDIGSKKFSNLGNKPLGCWGSGEKTFIEVIEPDKLKKRTAHVVGYPGDKCGYDAIEKHVRGASCQYAPSGKVPKKLVECLGKGLMASAQFGDKGRIVEGEATGASAFVLYDMDTCQGHSGSPVWVTSGLKRYLIGVHTGPFVKGKGTCADVIPSGGTIDTNRAVRLSAKVLEDVKKWMKG